MKWCKYSLVLVFVFAADYLPLASQSRSAVAFKNQIDGDLNTLTHSYPADAPRAFKDLRAKLAGQNQRSPTRLVLFPPQVICGYSVGHERETARIMYRFLSDTNPEVRRESMLTFSCFQPAYHLSLSFLLTRLSQDKSLLVRELAASSIGQLENLAAEAIPELTSLVSNGNEDPNLRAESLRALANIEGNSPNLIPLLENLITADPESGVQGIAYEALLERARSTSAARSAILHFIASIRQGGAAYLQARAIEGFCSDPSYRKEIGDSNLTDSLLVALRSEPIAANSAASCLSSMERAMIPTPERG